jgi:hypothetical protein
MPCSTSCCLYDTYGFMECSCVCMYVQTGWICLHTLYSIYCHNESIVHPVHDRWLNVELWRNAAFQKTEVLSKKSAHFVLQKIKSDCPCTLSPRLKTLCQVTGVTATLLNHITLVGCPQFGRISGAIEFSAFYTHLSLSSCIRVNVLTRKGCIIFPSISVYRSGIACVLLLLAKTCKETFLHSWKLISSEHTFMYVLIFHIN